MASKEYRFTFEGKNYKFRGPETSDPAERKRMIRTVLEKKGLLKQAGQQPAAQAPSAQQQPQTPEQVGQPLAQPQATPQPQAQQVNPLMQPQQRGPVVQPSQQQLQGLTPQQQGGVLPQAQPGLPVSQPVQQQFRTPQGLKDFAREELVPSGAAAAGALKGIAVGAPAGPGGMVAGAIVGAGLGGIAGEAIQETVHDLVDDPTVPPDARRILREAISRGQEEAVFEAAFTGAGPAISGLRKVLAPKFDDSVRWLQRALEEKGGTLTLSGAAPSGRISRWMESLFEDAPIGGQFFSNLKRVNRDILTNMQEDLIEKMTNQSLKNLSKEQTGALILDTVNTGNAIKSTIGDKLYSNLDDLVPGTKRTVQREVPSTVIDPSTGRPFPGRTVTEEVEVPPVDMTRAKRWAQNLLEEQERAGAQVGESGLTRIRAIANAPERMTFKDAHNMRSHLLGAYRNLPKDQQTATARKLLGEGQKALEEQLEAAIRGAGSEAKKQYQLAQDFWKQSSKKLGNKAVTALFRNQEVPEAIGKYLFVNGSPERVSRVFDAIDKAQELSRSARSQGLQIETGVTESALKEVPRVDGQAVKNKVLAQYLGEAMTQEGQDLASTKLLKIYDNRKMKETLDALLNPSQKRELDKLVSGIKHVTEAGKAPRGTMLAWRQTGLALQLLSGAGTLALQGSPGAAATGSLFVAIPTLSFLMTNPRTLRLLQQLAETGPSSPKAASLLARSVREFTKVAEQEGLPPPQPLEQPQQQEQP